MRLRSRSARPGLRHREKPGWGVAPRRPPAWRQARIDLNVFGMLRAPKALACPPRMLAVTLAKRKFRKQFNVNPPVLGFGCRPAAAISTAFRLSDLALFASRRCFAARAEPQSYRHSESARRGEVEGSTSTAGFRSCWPRPASTARDGTLVECARFRPPAWRAFATDYEAFSLFVGTFAR
jgi:hypothetical protein